MNYNLLAVTQSNGVISNKLCYVKRLQNIILNDINIEKMIFSPASSQLKKIT